MRTQIGRTRNAVKKTKALLSNQLPKPHSIKRNLGDRLGTVVIESQNDEIIARLWKEYMGGQSVPIEFGLSPANALAGNILLMPPDEDTKQALTPETIVRIGQSLKEGMLTTRADRYKEELEKEASALKTSQARKAKAELDKVHQEIRTAYENKMACLMEKCNAAILEGSEQAKQRIKNECRLKIAGTEDRIRQRTVDRLQRLAAQKEKDFRMDFDCHLTGIRQKQWELYSEALRSAQLAWSQMMAEMLSDHAKRLTRIRFTLEAEHVENMHELEYWKLVPKKEIKKQEVVAPVESSECSSLKESEPSGDHLSVYYGLIEEAERSLVEKDQLLETLKARLLHVLGDYQQFLVVSFRDRCPKMVAVQLKQVKLLTKQLNAMKTTGGGVGQQPEDAQSDKCKSTRRKKIVSL